MKLTVKPLAGSIFTVDAEPTDTIGEIKSKIQAAQGHAPEQQKLIFSGKILTDDKTVAACNIKSEKDFLVVMVSKPKPAKAAPAPAAAPAAEDPTPAAATSTEAAAAPVAASEAPEAPAPTSQTTASDSTTESTSAQQGSGSSSSFLSGSALESAIANMVEMGFERPQVEKALRASFNNPDRAVEYLMTGIPEHLNQPPQQQRPSGGAEPSTGAVPETPARQTGGATNAPSAPAPAARSGNLFEAAAAAAQQGTPAGGRGVGAGRLPDDGEGGQMLDLGNPAMLAELRSLLQQNPAALEPLVQAIAQSNPQLAEQLNANPEEVLQALSDMASEEGEGGGLLPSFDDLPPADRTAVETMASMGIPTEKAIEAYIMCGRNVEMAVQYYFENPGEFDD